MGKLTASRAKKGRILNKILLVAYIALLVFFMFFSDDLGRQTPDRMRSYNLEPFSEIKRFWNMRHSYGWSIPLMNILGNIVIFIPFGFLVPASSKKKFMKNFFTVMALTLALSAGIEVIQYVTKVGAFDIDDIILNMAGGFIGYICYLFARMVQ